VHEGPAVAIDPGDEAGGLAKPPRGLGEGLDVAPLDAAELPRPIAPRSTLELSG